MARPWESDERWNQGRRDERWGREERQSSGRWREGEPIESRPGSGDPSRWFDRRGEAMEAGTRDMDWGGGYGGGRDRGGGGGPEHFDRGSPGQAERGWEMVGRDRPGEDWRAGSRQYGGGERERWRGDPRGEGWRTDQSGWREGYRREPEGEYWARRGEGQSGREYGADRWRGGRSFGWDADMWDGRNEGTARYGASWSPREERTPGWQRDRRSESGYGGREAWGSDERRGESRGFMERMGERFREGVDRLTGKGPKNYRRSDDRIREDVCERLSRSGLDASEVEVTVDSGEVTLSGTVKQREDKRRIEDAIEDVFGVDEVHNQLRVDRTGLHGLGVSGQSASAAREDDETQQPH